MSAHENVDVHVAWRHVCVCARLGGDLSTPGRVAETVS